MANLQIPFAHQDFIHKSDGQPDARDVFVILKNTQMILTKLNTVDCHAVLLWKPMMTHGQPGKFIKKLKS